MDARTIGAYKRTRSQERAHVATYGAAFSREKRHTHGGRRSTRKLRFNAKKEDGEKERNGAPAHASQSQRALLRLAFSLRRSCWLPLRRSTGRGQVSVCPCQLDRMLPRASYTAGTWTGVVGCTGMHAVGWSGIPAALPRLLLTVRSRSSKNKRETRI